MSVEVRVTSVLQRVVGAKAIQSEGATVGELLDDMNARYPGLKEQITTEDGALHRFVNIYINDEDIRYLQSLDTPVKEGDVLSILPALAGGSLPVIASHRRQPRRGNPASSETALGFRHRLQRFESADRSRTARPL